MAGVVPETADVMGWTVKGLSAWAENSERAAKALELMASPPDVRVGETPATVVWQENKMKVLRYEAIAPRKHATPIVVVYALVNRPAILDLQPDRSVVRRLLEAGHDVYLIDWGTPSPLDQHLTLADYVNRYIHNAVRVAKRESGVEQVSILGYCMGGAMSVMYASLHPENVKNLALMAAPLDFANDPSLLTAWAKPEHFQVDPIVDAYRNIPADFLAGGFQYLKPFENTVGKFMSLYKLAGDEKAVENYFRMEKWNSDGIPLPGETYRQYIKDLYQTNRLAQGKMEIDGKRVSLAPLTMPLLAITGDNDHLVPAISTTAFVDRAPSADKASIRCATGHIGLSVSSRSHKEVWPKVAQWFAERSEAT